MISYHHRMRASKFFLLPFFLALLAFAPDGLQAQAPAPAASPSAGPTVVPMSLTPAFMEKMLKLISAQGQDRECPSQFANALGLSAPGKTWADRQVVADGKSTGFVYGFAVSRGSEQDLLITVRQPAALLAFRAHRDGTIVSAFSFDAQSQKFSIRTPLEAQAPFAKVCAFWQANIDKLLSVSK